MHAHNVCHTYTHAHRLNPALVANRIRELNNEVAALRMDISPIYAELLMKFSSFDKGQQDRCGCAWSMHACGVAWLCMLD